MYKLFTKQTVFFANLGVKNVNLLVFVKFQKGVLFVCSTKTFHQISVQIYFFHFTAE